MEEVHIPPLRHTFCILSDAVVECVRQYTKSMDLCMMQWWNGSDNIHGSICFVYCLTQWWKRIDPCMMIIHNKSLRAMQLPEFPGRNNKKSRCGRCSRNTRVMGTMSMLYM